MKKINQYKFIAGVFAVSLLASCNYEEINTNPFELTDRHTNSQDYLKECKDATQPLSLHFLFCETPQAATGNKANAHTSNLDSGIQQFL